METALASHAREPACKLDNQSPELEHAHPSQSRTASLPHMLSSYVCTPRLHRSGSRRSWRISLGLRLGAAGQLVQPGEEGVVLAAGTPEPVPRREVREHLPGPRSPKRYYLLIRVVIRVIIRVLITGQPPPPLPNVTPLEQPTTPPARETRETPDGLSPLIRG